MTRTIKASAPAKINLTFNIKGTLPDGYHEVETLLQAIDLEDHLTLHFEPADELTVEISCNSALPTKLFPCDESNLIYKSAKLFRQAMIDRLSPDQVKQHLKISVEVEKIIPIGAGLAGGSADAAATLTALNAVYGNPLETEELIALGSKLGADVPFCLAGGTAVGTGRGDELRQEDIDATLYFCIVKPRKQSVSTPWAYQQYDLYKEPVPQHPTDTAIKALREADFEQAIPAFGNGFEPVIFSHIPELPQLKKQLIDLGAWCCHLSGSGPALFAIVGDREQAHYIRRKVLKNDDDGFEYGSAYASFEYGPPIEFHIAQSIKEGARVTT